MNKITGTRPAKLLCCVLEQDTTQEDRKLSRHDGKIVDWGVEHQTKQNKNGKVPLTIFRPMEFSIKLHCNKVRMAHCIY